MKSSIFHALPEQCRTFETWSVMRSPASLMMAAKSESTSGSRVSGWLLRVNLIIRCVGWGVREKHRESERKRKRGSESESTIERQRKRREHERTGD